MQVAFSSRLNSTQPQFGQRVLRTLIVEAGYLDLGVDRFFKDLKALYEDVDITYRKERDILGKTYYVRLKGEKARVDRVVDKIQRATRG